MIETKSYIPRYQKQVKGFVIKAHEEFGFTYNIKLDYDLENPEKIYLDNGGEFLLLLDDDKLIGTIALKLSENNSIAELKRFYIDKKHREKRYGYMLFNIILDIAKEKSIKQIILETNVIQKKAIDFYRRNGFLVTKQIGNKLYMRKSLD